MIMKNKVTIVINAEDNLCRVSMNGFASEHKCEVHEFDHEGQEAVTIDVEGVGEFISYDDGETWGDMD
jgi:hypothetical protein